MSKCTVLIIEDEKNILTFMGKVLKNQDYRVLSADTGAQGLELIRSQCPDIILLDLGLPDMDGDRIIQEVRTWTSIPIIVISARTAEKDKVRSLDLGADDYITKPFGTSELLARIRASLRHSNRLRTNDTLYLRPYRHGGMVLDFSRRLLTVDGNEIHLTPIEYKIVACLAQNSCRNMANTVAPRRSSAICRSSDVLMPSLLFGTENPMGHGMSSSNAESRIFLSQSTCRQTKNKQQKGRHRLSQLPSLIYAGNFCLPRSPNRNDPYSMVCNAIFDNQDERQNSLLWCSAKAARRAVTLLV